MMPQGLWFLQVLQIQRISLRSNFWGCSFSCSLLVKDIKDLSLKWYVLHY